VLAAEVASLEASLLAERAEVRSLRASLAAHQRLRASDAAAVANLRAECSRLRGEIESMRIAQNSGDAAREARGEREMELLGAAVARFRVLACRQAQLLYCSLNCLKSIMFICRKYLPFFFFFPRA
jgi:hypothetical protein